MAGALRRRRRTEHDVPPDGDAPPLLAELFSIGQLQRHAEKLAGRHEVGRATHEYQLVSRLADNEATLEAAYSLLASATQRGRQITPAAEWLVDNHHLIQEQIAIARRHLPKGYSRELPRIINGSADVPRVYVLALELISHLHGQLDVEALRVFVKAYQSVQPLAIGELWAIAIMLRFALIENLRRVAAKVTAGRRDRERAGLWADRLIDLGESDPSGVVLALADMIEENPELTTAFVTELARRLQGHGAVMVFPLTWLEQRLGERGQTLDHMFSLAVQSQASDQVAIGNSIGSLRSLAAIDWREFVEDTSVVSRALETDPVYLTMSFATRDHYRHVIERIARRSPMSELEIAQAAIALARAREQGTREAHVGYFLIDAGRHQLERVTRARHGIGYTFRRLARTARLPLYVGSITALTLAATVGLTLIAPRELGAALVAWTVVVALCASQLAIAIVHWAITLALPPGVLPRLDFTKGIPDAHRTLVAVPTLLTSVEAVDELVATLELRFLANRDANLGFALVTDLRDAKQETLDGDAELLAHARAKIEELSTKYDHAGGFFLFHRTRRWNPRERVWMGWERKRGKLEDLNAALRGARDRFSLIVGPIDKLAGVRYVIALDSDTGLPRDSGRELAATIGHPLNRPVFDERRGRVVQGYGILQPRVGHTLTSANASHFARLCAGECGIDPYTLAVSDVYQDVFDEGSFVGKGIYDIDAVERAYAGRFPDNRILSHDLLEGGYARAGLVSDIVLLEDYPAAYAADASRRSRWIRGDWQTARWLLGWVPHAKGTERNPLSMLSRWKILDNLRRSVVPLGMTVLLVVGGLVPGVAVLAVTLVAATLVVSNLLCSLAASARRPEDVSRDHHAGAIAKTFRAQLVRDCFALACLPYDALLGASAIARAVVRLAITRRRLLEWRTAADAQRSSRLGLFGTYLDMWIQPVAAIGGIVVLAAIEREAMWMVAPLCALWLIAPMLVWWASRPLVIRAPSLSTSDLAFLRALARRCWRFFEVVVVAEEHDLPPDNLQVDPPVGIAHRTSPTNIGLGLLANLAAHDFGYIATDEVIARLTRTFATLDKLERCRGHFYNWYDTRTLEPLRPCYVSTVDSGNLAAHLLVLASGLDELAERPLIGPSFLDGIADTVSAIERDARDQRTPIVLGVVRALIAKPPVTLSGWRALLERLVTATGNARRDHAGLIALISWLDTLAASAIAMRDLLADSTPWLDHVAGDRDRFDRVPTLAEIVTLAGSAHGELEASLQLAATRATDRIARLAALAMRARGFADLDFELVYDRGRQLMSIGYNVADHRLDKSFYDLLASEARLASFVAIAQNKLPQEHWFRLGRQITSLPGGRTTLMSWSGSMFEYLMPVLVMPDYEGTLLDVTYRGAVARQIDYGKERGVPWGISESGYFKIDAQLNYQYRAFGVPGLGFKRGLADELVVAPYASALALMVDAEAACANLRRLDTEERAGELGLFEAVDYTAARMPPGKSSVVVKSYMAHHQGMTFLALAYRLLDRPMQRRFERDPSLRATAMLLQERVPRTPGAVRNLVEVADPLAMPTTAPAYHARTFTTPDTPTPEVQLLSNGNYHVAITNAGGGYSRLGDLAVTRWREDTTRDSWGSFCYVRDVGMDAFWSVAHQPTLRIGESYEAIFSAGRAEFRRRDHDVDCHVEIAVSTEDDIELRRISLSNVGLETRVLEVTSYAEVVLASAAADAAHRTFSNLFVETELIPEQSAIICTRRPRAPGEKPPWLVHLLSLHAPFTGAPSFETDRAAFIGRDRSPHDPIAMHRAVLGNSQGAVLDPIVAIRDRVELRPNQTAQLHIVTGVVQTREAALALIEKYGDRHIANRVLELAWTQAQAMQRRLDASSEDVTLFQELAGNIVYASPELRAAKSMIARNELGQAGLWAYGISGDLPIAVVRISDGANIALVRRMARAHTYWRAMGLVVDLVIINEDPTTYRQNVHDQIVEELAGIIDSALVDRPGGVFVRRGDQISEAARVLLQSIARIVLTDTAGTLAEQVDRRLRSDTSLAALVPRRKLELVRTSEPAAVPERTDLAFWNGHGGFTRDGREYVIVTTPSSRTPMPWCNVIANSYFGTVVSESGSAYTWCENAHEHRLTPWSNDPVADGSGEVLYLRDEEDGRFWSPTPAPCGGRGPWTTRHGFGYSIFETEEAEIASELRTFVATDAPVKFLLVKLRNTSGRPRRISLTASFDLVLGEHRTTNALHTVTELDSQSGALFARNPYAGDFSRRVALLDCSESQRWIAGDRLEVIGRNSHPSKPACMTRVRLSGRVGAGLDPCMAMQTVIELANGEEREVAFVFGSGRDLDDARAIVGRFRGVGRAHVALEEVWRFWNHTLGAVSVQTPDPSVDFLANGWLLYQVISARMWGRSGLYQSGGAYGFRDQLQDAMALVHAEPSLLREQIIRAASRQFTQGDVQHWWHPPAGRGVRTRISDDLLWLPYAVARYVTQIGDAGVLDEPVEFIEGRAVTHDEESYYDLPARSLTTGPIYEHCVRAIEHAAAKIGAHGLPLMGTGDWNDGMNLVGAHGKGESVWLAFFFHDVLVRFADVALLRGDRTFEERCRTMAKALEAAIERSAWDGAWYRRAYFDDGTPLGSATNDECQIDSLPQSWSALTGVGSSERMRAGLAAVDTRLVDRQLRVVKLFDPPFDTSAVEPGYIKGYVPGVRENGGQYTHAAVWATMAFAAAGEIEKAWELFSMIDPVRHGGDAASSAIYKVEPYVVAADVYTEPRHEGMGGWTWYTGSAAWMYRLVVESLLGLRLDVDRLHLEPRVPAAWQKYTIHYRYRDTVHHIDVVRRGLGSAVTRVVLDGDDRPDRTIALRDDQREHWATVDIG